VATRRVKLADFGLAKMDRQTVTRGVGTPSYMPPEMFADEDNPEKTNMLAVDVYALGVILWQLWYQTEPWFGKAIHKVVMEVTKGRRPPLARAAAQRGQEATVGNHTDRADAPEPLAALVEACWAQLPADRPLIASVFEIFDQKVVPVAGGGAGGAGGGAGVLDLEDVAVPVAPPSTVTMRGLLEPLGLGQYIDAFVTHGFTDLATLADAELLTDDILFGDIKLKRLEVRKLRSHLAASSRGGGGGGGGEGGGEGGGDDGEGTLGLARVPRAQPAVPATSEQARIAVVRTAAAATTTAGEDGGEGGGEDGAASSALEAVAAGSVAALLGKAGLQRFEPNFAAFGFTEPELFSTELCGNEGFLLSDVGMSREDVKRLRALVEANKAQSPAMCI